MWSTGLAFKTATCAAVATVDAQCTLPLSPSFRTLSIGGEGVAQENPVAGVVRVHTNKTASVTNRGGGIVLLNRNTRKACEGTAIAWHQA